MSTYGPYPARVIDLHDGDTCHLDLDLGFGFMLNSHDFQGHPMLSCRVFGINAPELSTEAGKIALAYARTIMPPGTIVSVLSHGWDKYGGRFDGEIILPDASNFGLRMIDAGQALDYLP